MIISIFGNKQGQFFFVINIRIMGNKKEVY